MRLAEVGVLYGLVGMGCAVSVAWQRQRLGTRLVDALLALVLWPIYAPFVFLRHEVCSDAPSEEAAFLAAIRRASGTPLASLLPRPENAERLAARLRLASHKVREIDLLLQKPEFSEEVAQRRHIELRDRSASTFAVSTAKMRIQNIHRLRSLRNRFARELDEVKELIAQLRTQAEVVRLVGSADDVDTGIIEEIVCRVEGLDRILDDGGELWPTEETVDSEARTSGA